MTSRSRRSSFAAAVLAAFVWTSASLAEPPADPWAKVPALPTACYSEQDQHWAAVDAARASLQAEIEQQEEVNARIKSEFDAIDPMEQAQRMSQWMMEHPEEAQAYMQHVSEVGQTMGANIEKWTASTQKIDAEEKDLLARYQTALDEAYGSAEARQSALLARAEREGANTDGEGTPDWVIEEWTAISRERDRGYQSICPQWWGASGQVQTWLERYQKWLREEDLAVQQGQDDEQARTYAILGTPAAAYRPTAGMKGVVKFLDKSQRLYGHREGRARCEPGGGRCD